MDWKKITKNGIESAFFSVELENGNPRITYGNLNHRFGATLKREIFKNFQGEKNNDTIQELLKQLKKIAEDDEKAVKDFPEKIKFWKE